MHVAIMGTGGVGGYYWGMLARAGEDVTFIARGAHLEAMLSSGLTLKTTHAGEFNIPVKATDDPGEIGTVDQMIGKVIIILMRKQVEINKNRLFFSHIL